MCDYISLMNNRKLIVFKVNDLNIGAIQEKKSFFSTETASYSSCFLYYLLINSIFPFKHQDHLKINKNCRAYDTLIFRGC